jgi:hypothetical protein
MRFTINTYSARGHAIGSGGNGENRRGGGSSRVVHLDEELGDRIETATVIKSERSRFIDQVLAKIQLRNALQSANAEDLQADNETSEERQQKRKRAA